MLDKQLTSARKQLLASLLTDPERSTSDNCETELVR